MKCTRNLQWILLGIALLAPFTGAMGVEIIQIRTGQVGGVPGTCPGADDVFRFNPVGMPPCALPFRTTSFAPADFAAAASGPPAVVIPPLGPYLPTLPSDPLARWIDWQEFGGCASAGQPNSVLYAARFVVQTPCSPVASIRICWAVDDVLGDPAGGGPNPIGIYVNGTPLSAGFSGGNYAQETCVVQANVPVNPGVNYLYVYQRDLGCGRAGVILSATMSITPGAGCPPLLGFKFNDLNGNGILDGGEPPMAGWQLNLTGPVNLSGVTNASGIYDFGCVPPGTYTMTETTQPGWIQTTPPGGAQHFVVNCGQDMTPVYFGNRQCQQGQSPCVALPSCMAAWFPFDECAGTTANEVLANRDGTIIGGVSNPTWGGGRPGSPCGLNFPGLPGTQKVVAADCPEHNFGTGSFTIAAWVRTNVNDAVIHEILDKRVVPFGSPTGYAMYIYGGVLRFQYNDGSASFTTHLSTAPPLGDGNWHLVAVSVCRNPNNPSANVARLYVDNYVDTFTTGIPTGSLTNTAGLTIGDQCPGFIEGLPFAGAIDDVMLFKCCLTPQQVQALRVDLPYCAEKCHVPSILNTAGLTKTTTLTLCNYSVTPQTYTWTIAGLPAGPGCSIAGPTSFSPVSGTVTIPGATSGPACVNIPITITLPSGMTFGQTTCYQVTTQNMGTGRCCITRGRIRRSKPIHIDVNPPYVAIPVGLPLTLHFPIYNDGDLPLDVPYRVSVHSSDDDDQNLVVRLNGLPPGIPVEGMDSAPPHGSADVDIRAELIDSQPLNPNEVVIEADVDGDGVMEPVTCITIFSLAATGPADAPEVTPVSVVGTSVLRLLATPNPFRNSTTIQLYASETQPSVHVDVFNVGGRLVREIYDGALAAGTRTFVWDGLDSHGAPTGSGLYFLRASSSKSTVTTKLISLE